MFYNDYDEIVLNAQFNQGVVQGKEEGIKEGMQKGIEQGIEQGVKKGIEQGIEQGVKKGIEQGIEQGVKKANKHIAIKLLKKNYGLDIISEVTNLTKKQIKDIQATML